MAKRIISASILIVALLVGNVALYQNADLITMFLCGAGYTENSEQAIAARESGNKRAALAMDIFVHYIKKIVGSYIAEMNGVDALVFTAGIGENDRELRERVCREMSYLGIEIDEELNKTSARGADVELTKLGAKVRTFVLPTNEEYMIALDTYELAK